MLLKFLPGALRHWKALVVIGLLLGNFAFYGIGYWKGKAGGKQECKAAAAQESARQMAENSTLNERISHEVQGMDGAAVNARLRELGIMRSAAQR